MSTLYDEFHRSFVKTQKQLKLITEGNFTYVNFFRYILPALKKASPKRILDVGSGAGAISLFLGNLGYQVLGVDISFEAISASNQSALKLGLDKNVKFIAGDFGNFSTNKRFDLIICFEIIEHYEDDMVFLKKIHSLLKRDGLLVLSTPLVTAPLTKIGLTEKFDKSVGHLRRYEKNSIVRKITGADFVIEKVIETEGILRNSFYVFKRFNYLVRFIRKPFASIITFMDDFLGQLFGFSDVIILARKK